MEKIDINKDILVPQEEDTFKCQINTDTYHHSITRNQSETESRIKKKKVSEQKRLTDTKLAFLIDMVLVCCFHVFLSQPSVLAGKNKLSV